MRRELRFWDICSGAEVPPARTAFTPPSWEPMRYICVAQGKSQRVVGYKNGEYVDFDINEALAMQKEIPPYQYEVARALSANYDR